MARLQRSVCACNYPEFRRLQTNARMHLVIYITNTELLIEFKQLAVIVFTFV